MVEPDLEGYRAALLEKREALGQAVEFFFPSTLKYPEGTVLDPATGKPYDPLIEPESGTGRPNLTVPKLSVAFRPNFQEDTEEAALGDVKMNVALVWVTMEEWETTNGGIKDAIGFFYMEDKYLIRKATHEAIGGEAWRVLVWGERDGQGTLEVE